MGGRLRNAIDNASAAGYNANELISKVDGLLTAYDKQGYMELAVEIPLDGPILGGIKGLLRQKFGEKFSELFEKKDKIQFSIKIKVPDAEVNIVPPEEN